MRVAILGASGILGQYLRLHQSQRHAVRYVSRLSRDLHWVEALDLTSESDTAAWLREVDPEVIINLAGVNSVDAVESAPVAAWELNVELPRRLVEWCASKYASYIHVSSQAVFSGTSNRHLPERLLESDWEPVNEYGKQKREAERVVRHYAALRMPQPRPLLTIVRPTTLLGVRPLPRVGRASMLESILRGGPQVQDRWFSPCFPTNAAHHLWNLVDDVELRGGIYHLGEPVSVTRLDIAHVVRAEQERLGEKPIDVEPVFHGERFAAFAQRPHNTTYADHPRLLHGSEHWEEQVRLHVRLAHTARRLSETLPLDVPHAMEMLVRARHLAMFSGVSLFKAHLRLGQGFGHAHSLVSRDYVGAGSPTDLEGLLAWYRATDTYLWELSAYHLDPGFNYRGMIQGIGERLLQMELGPPSALVLGDGIGDTTAWLRGMGILSYYHDLRDSLTARFADMVFGHPMLLSTGWEPPMQAGDNYGAILALDFFEHVPNVETWAIRAYEALRPGGYLVAQNAFGIGSPDREGSIPMHLASNTHWEHDWAPLVTSLGFERAGDIWWRKRLS
jgi:dTDP-4-dehydrorhamnose reductase